MMLDAFSSLQEGMARRAAWASCRTSCAGDASSATGDYTTINGDSTTINKEPVTINMECSTIHRERNIITREPVTGTRERNHHQGGNRHRQLHAGGVMWYWEETGRGLAGALRCRHPVHDGCAAGRSRLLQGHEQRGWRLRPLLHRLMVRLCNTRDTLRLRLHVCCELNMLPVVCQHGRTASTHSPSPKQPNCKLPINLTLP